MRYSSTRFSSNVDTLDPYEIKNNFYKGFNFKAGKLKDSDIMRLAKLYHSHVADVRPLTKDEAFLFSGQDSITASIAVQTLYKVTTANEYAPDVIHNIRNYRSSNLIPAKGSITPLNFRHLIEEYVSQNPALRTNYFTTDDGKTLAVELIPCDFTNPDLSFHVLNTLDGDDLDEKLEKVMMADRHRPFTLYSGSLLRIGVYRLSFRSYAILISQPQLIANSWDPELFLRDLMPYDELPEYKPVKKISFVSAFTSEGKGDRAPIINYWKRALENLPEKPQLPQYAPSTKIPVHRAITFKINSAETDKIRNKIVDTDRNFWIAMLETAWGLMLQSVNHSNDTHFPLLLPFRGAKLENSTSVDMHNALPMRVKCTPDITVRDLVKQQLVQLMGAQPMGRPTRQELVELTGQDSRYNHILSFQGFWAETTTFSKHPNTNGIYKLAMNISDTGRDIAVYFRFNGSEILLEILFNENTISTEALESTVKNYHAFLMGMIKYWTRPVDDLKVALDSSYQPALEKIALEGETLAKRIKELPLFSALKDDQLKDLANQSIVHNYAMDDIIMNIGDSQHYFMFLLNGKIVRYMEEESGWMNPLDVVKPDGIVNETALLKEKSPLFAQVSSDRAVLLAVPIKTMESLMMKHADISLKFSKHLLRELKKYHKRWINT